MLYWAITTMTTIGYGDIVAFTAREKTAAVVVMVPFRVRADGLRAARIACRPPRAPRPSLEANRDPGPQGPHAACLWPAL